MRPPIPPPTGKQCSLTDEQINEGISISYKMTFVPLVRKNLKELAALALNPVLILIATLLTLLLMAIVLDFFNSSGRSSTSFAPLVFVVFVFCFFFIVLLSGCLSYVLPVFQSTLDKLDKTTILTRYGVVRREKATTVEVAWASIFWIVLWAGDVLLCTFASTTFIPRQAFNSPQEAEEFVQIARELHKTRGAAWRDEWNRKTFGQKT